MFETSSSSAPAFAGAMQSSQLLIIDLLRHSVRRHPQQEIVSRRIEGDIHRYTYAECYQRSCQLAHCLTEFGVQPGERVATLAWNTYRHLELYYAVSGMGAILHTVNPRLIAEQIEWILNDANATWLFVDACFSELAAQVVNKVPQLKGVIVLADDCQQPELKECKPPLHAYEQLLDGQATDFNWPALHEDSAALLCYTSGTTGNPKGVLSSHRAMVLHAQATVSAELLDLRATTVLMPMVAMYHAGAWGAPYAAPLAGCKLVLPGNGMSGEAMHQLIEAEQVTVGLGVPTIWLTLHNYLAEHATRLPTLERVCVGGAASPLGLVKTFDQDYDVYWQPIWGMTETGPLASSAPPEPSLMALPLEQRYEIQTTAGRACFGVEMQIVDADGAALPHDGETSGELRVRGPWIASSYFQRDDPDTFADGWLATGDIAVIDPQGYMKVVDRKKDVIKSGGEWISSLDIENICSQHPAVNESCVFGVKHPKWDERPLLLVVVNKGEQVDKATLYQFLQGKIAKWWMPDDILFVSELPHTGTGKLVKNQLRKQYQNYLLEQTTDA
ncbi:3-methylmercaptopropionyl-CoA ligase [Pseudidiomarina piscicola]|uniref:3-methylmercaptopropionyl-CoA ligase n=1 Tax=Pseudidiomarina piscicola TaxID=2614830 RepID=A0A6S6WPH5_9GAMM|nr:long-chain fatty acid--CoA ligase [Pseudidiomarina piscicola]CAB0151590.1 3-methylmercaptopropionyl-CoA ligase [Pseudidiomarina piscicola]VZT41055.1 3-methylmercaptopropionyl-CoA ligase [Pseudomonas aeruginosa]